MNRPLPVLLSCFSCAALWAAPGSVWAAPDARPLGAAELARAIDRLSVVGNVLYIAAHPDDENTRLLAYLANERLLRTAYLSLTRGDGGQNLIGSEQGPLLGLIRTQELLAARAIDGAEQFFTRALDFGYSKTPDETLRIWGRDEILADIVWVIRRFRPDVIITRFPAAGTDTHGHHTASAILAEAAFRAAADRNYHPEQLAHAEPWQARRIVWNRSLWNARPTDDLGGFFKLDVGGYNPYLGLSYGELAARSRSMHKSQGFGAAASRGESLEYFRVIGGDPASRGIFDGLDLSWRRVVHAERLASLLHRARADFRLERPESAIPALLEARAALAALPENPWKAQKQQELDAVLVGCAGLFAEVTATDWAAVPGGEVAMTVTALGRSTEPARLERVTLPGGVTVPAGQPLRPEHVTQVQKTVTLDRAAPFSNPYWLAEKPAPGRFTVSNLALLGLPESPPPLTATLVFTLGNQKLEVVRPLLHKWTDPVAGEQSRLVQVVPEVTINAARPVLMFPDSHARPLRVTLAATTAAEAAGVLRPEAPAGWRIEPETHAFRLAKGAEEEVLFQIKPPAESSAAAVRLVAEIEGRRLSRSLVRIEHAHIPIQTLLPEAEVKLVRFDLAAGAKRIGYIPGAGDEVAPALRQVGYDVTILSDEMLTTEKLGRFDAIVAGVRAFNTHRLLPSLHRKLMDYVSAGGTLLVQYNTNNRISKAPLDIGPYPFEISQDRVTDETATVDFGDAAAAHAVLRRPNRLTAADFTGWVQERGLYFAGTWDPKYETPLAMHDPSEPAKKGSLLVARLGKGTFIYTGLAFFRQLPAGVPGAFRLFANLLAHGR